MLHFHVYFLRFAFVPLAQCYLIVKIYREFLLVNDMFYLLPKMAYLLRKNSFISTQLYTE